jgi:uncharacterized repeat protein (TIGR01451 family)
MKYLPNALNLLAVKVPELTKISIKNKSSQKASSTAWSAPKKDVVVIDSRVENYEQLLGGVKAGTEVFVLNLVQDAIGQITEILGQCTNINTLHIVSHGQEAALKLGLTELNIYNIETYSSQLQQWGKALGKSGSILLYGCNVATGESGIKFVQKLSEITGANIAASKNLTGSAALGGDWELEIATGRINAELAFEKSVLEAYTSVLATLVNESFKGDTIIGPWIYGTGSTVLTGIAIDNPGLTAGAANPNGIIPSIGVGDPGGSGALQLTSNKKSQAAFVIYDNPISSAQGLKVTFDFFAYNTSTDSDFGLGADGTSFFLIDGTATPTRAGGFAGSLGYAPNNNISLGAAGILGGYLGVGLDEFGFFSRVQSGTDGRVGGRPLTDPRLPDTVAVRGSQSQTYRFLSSSLLTNNLTGLSIGIDNETATSRTVAKRTVQITLFPATAEPNGRLAVAIDLNNNGTFDAGETLIDIPNLALPAVNGALPPTFKFGFAAATGNSTNIHEVANLIVESIDPPPQADVSITKKGPQLAPLGGTINYTITSTNIGPSTTDAKDVLIQDILPPGVTFLSADNGGTVNTLTRTVSWPAIPTLASGVSTTRIITAIAPAIATTITNVAYSNSSTFDPVVANNNSSLPTSQAITTIISVADVITTKTGSATGAPGGTVSYTISTVNNGPNTAANVVVTDSIVPGLTGVVVSNGGTYNAVTGIVSFPSIPSLPSGVPATTVNTVSFIAPAGLSVTNTASSTSPTPDPTPTNNNGTSPTATVTTALTPTADVVTTKTGSATAVASATVSYTISTVNNGPSAATNVTVTDSIVPGLTGVVVSNGGVYNATTGIVTFPPIASLASGAPAVANTVSFVAPAGISVSNTASSISATPDANPANNNGTSPTATVTTALTPKPAPTPLNQPPVANNANAVIAPNSTVKVPGLGGTDPDGSIASYKIDTLPPVAQGVLFLGDPANGGVAVTPGQVLTPAQISQLFFKSTGTFTGANFSYSATDNLGLSSPAAATVSALPPSVNQPPVTNNANVSVAPGGTVPLAGLGGTDPDGSIASFTINTLPPAAQGVLFLGDPANGGVAVTPGQVLTPAQISQLFFKSTGTFSGANFTYSATDNLGLSSPAPATIAALPAPVPTPTPTPAPTPAPTPIPAPIPIPTPTPTPTPTPAPTPTPNVPPVATNANLSITPNGSKLVTGLGGTDPDGTIASFTINTLPPAAQGLLFLGDPANGGIAVTPGQTLTPAQIQQLFFQATGSFSGANFTYSATDNLGLNSSATATVALGALPLPLPTLTPEPEIECDCEPLVGKPGINFPLPTQPPEVSFKRPISQLGNGQTTKGTDGNDVILDFKGNQKIIGFKGNDLLIGLGGADEIHGDEGNDTIYADTGTDIVFGGRENDLIFAGKDNDWVAGELGSDTILGDRGADTILGDTGMNNSQNPNNARDLIYGGDGADVINSNEGDDTIHAGKGNDIALGGRNNDIIWGEIGNDTLIGGTGNDSLFGGNPDKKVIDAGGRDLLYGGDGNDLLNGQEGDDTLIAGKDHDRVYGGKGNDLIFGQLGSDTLYGGAGIDTILGDSGSSEPVGDAVQQDLIFGGDGGDIIGGGNGDDTVHAGKGNDCAWGGKDNDLIWGDVGNDSLTGDSGNDTLYGGVQGGEGQDPNGKDWLFGNRGSDWLFGMESDDTIAGGKENDRVYGGKGNDLIHGDNANDLIYGGDGNDILCGDEGNDTIFGDRSDNRGVPVGANGQKDCINGGAGDDLLYGNEGEDELNGDAGNDTLYGGKDNDILFGGEGDDILFGGEGDNTLSGGAGSDQFILGALQGSNTILNFEAGIDKLVLTGGLTFQQLVFTPTQNGTLLQVAGTTQVLANLVGGIGAIGPNDVRSNLLSQ